MNTSDVLTPDLMSSPFVHAFLDEVVVDLGVPGDQATLLLLAGAMLDRIEADGHADDVFLIGDAVGWPREQTDAFLGAAVRHLHPAPAAVLR